MIKTVLTWSRPLEKKPPLARDVLVYLPKAPQQIRIGYTMDGFVWHDAFGLPFHHHVTHWAEPTAPKGKR